MTTAHMSPFLHFTGEAGAATEHYRSVFGGEVASQTSGSFKMGDDPRDADLVMHAQLDVDPALTLTASDVPHAMREHAGQQPPRLPVGRRLRSAAGPLRRHVNGDHQPGRLTAVEPVPQTAFSPLRRRAPASTVVDVPSTEEHHDDRDAAAAQPALHPLVVSPGPSFAHQTVLANLHLLLRGACPPDPVVLLAPFAVGLAEGTEVRPDLLVAPRSQFTATDLPGAPLSAVEVLSPSTRRIDLLPQRDRLQQASCPSYWLVDPDGPSLTALELQAGSYREAAVVTGAQSWTAAQPFDVTVVPADLVR